MRPASARAGGRRPALRADRLVERLQRRAQGRDLEPHGGEVLVGLGECGAAVGPGAPVRRGRGGSAAMPGGSPASRAGGATRRSRDRAPAAVMLRPAPGARPRARGGRSRRDAATARAWLLRRRRWSRPMAARAACGRCAGPRRGASRWARATWRGTPAATSARCERGGQHDGGAISPRMKALMTPMPRLTLTGGARWAAAGGRRRRARPGRRGGEERRGHACVAHFFGSLYAGRGSPGRSHPARLAASDASPR